MKSEIRQLDLTLSENMVEHMEFIKLSNSMLSEMLLSVGIPKKYIAQKKTDYARIKSN